MIIPFCLDSCYDAPIATTPTTVIVQQAQNPVAGAQPIVNITNSQPQLPMQTPLYGMQQQPPMMQQQPVPVMAQAQHTNAAPTMVQAAMVVDTAPKGGGASPSTAAAGPQTLSEFLVGLNLAQYDAQFREMGAVDVLDLADVSEVELEQVSATTNNNHLSARFA